MDWIYIFFDEIEFDNNKKFVLNFGKEDKIGEVLSFQIKNTTLQT